MARSFGEGDQKTFFVMERFSPGDSFALLVVGKPIASARLKSGRPVEIAARFGPVENAQKFTAMPATFNEMPGFLVSSASFAELSSEPHDGPHRIEIDAARERAVSNLTISKLGAKDVVLELGSMAKPMEAMRACTDELLTHWGIDVERHAKRSKDVTPKSSPGRWVLSQDYPLKMLRQGAQALVHFRLMVGADGKPTSCHIQRSTSPQEFDETVCSALMRRADFEPALDAGGAPIISFFQTSVRFQAGS